MSFATFEDASSPIFWFQEKLEEVDKVDLDKVDGVECGAGGPLRFVQTEHFIMKYAKRLCESGLHRSRTVKREVFGHML